MPISASIEPTTACNLRCPECPSGLRIFSRNTGNLKYEDFELWINQIKNYLLNLTFYFQGEPFINKDIFKMIAFANKNKIYTRTSTNGHFLQDANCKEIINSGLSELVISIDGSTQDVYAKYRVDGNLDHVLQGAKNLVDWRKNLKATSPFIKFQFIVFKHNEHQINEIYALAKKIGIDQVEIKSAQIYNYESGSTLITENEIYSRYKKVKENQFKIKSDLPNECWRMWHACVITWDGNIVPCCYDKDAQHVLGKLSLQKFTDIWHGEKYAAFRKQIFVNRSQVEMCRNCTEGLKLSN